MSLQLNTGSKRWVAPCDEMNVITEADKKHGKWKEATLNIQQVFFNFYFGDVCVASLCDEKCSIQF